MRGSCLLFACLTMVAGAAAAQQVDRPESDTGVGVTPSLVERTRTAVDESARPSQPQTTFRGGVDVVALNVVVTDTQQQFMPGLDSSHFAVFEDGVRQDVSFFATSAVPLDLAILLDTSASMLESMDTLQRAAIGFASSLRAGDRTMVVDIKDRTSVLQSLTTDDAAVAAAIRSTRARGGTAIMNGVYLTLAELSKERRLSPDVRRQAIVIMSDGEDTASLMSFEDVMDAAKASGIAIYTITLKSKYVAQRNATGRSRYFSQSDFAMKSLAQETGARAFFPSAIGDLAGIYSSIADELSTQYSLGYASKNVRHDGRFRRIVVQVTGHPEARTRAKNGYVAATSEHLAQSRP